MEGVMEATEKRGRPRVERDPDERVPMSLRIRGELFNRLSEMARANNRPLGLECEYRLERSFEHSVVPAEDRDLLLRFLATYRHGGYRAVVRLLLDLDEPDFKERELRRQLMVSTLINLDPTGRKSGFVPVEDPPAVEEPPR
jgi:hypothetical protein